MEVHVPADGNSLLPHCSAQGAQAGLAGWSDLETTFLPAPPELPLISVLLNFFYTAGWLAQAHLLNIFTLINRDYCCDAGSVQSYQMQARSAAMQKQNALCWQALRHELWTGAGLLRERMQCLE